MTQFEKSKISKTFCIYPWITQYVGPIGDVKPCCIYEPNLELGNLKSNTLKEIWNSKETKQIRLDMLAGVNVPGCSKCNNREGIVTSHRTEANDIFLNLKNADLINSTAEDGSLPTHQLQYIDARFNNLCNLRCRTCGPSLSSSWHEDFVKTNGGLSNQIGINAKALRFPGNTEGQLLEEILPHLPYVERIYFAGGEPLMQHDHYRVLEELIKIGHTGSHERKLQIVYNTNFTNLKLGKYSALDMWNHFFDIKISASLDASYERAEYWRKGSKWDVIVKNRMEMIERCPDVQFDINCTLSWTNAFNVIDFHREWHSLGLLGIDKMIFNVLDHPHHFSIKNIPTWKKNSIEREFLNQIQWLEENYASNRAISQYQDAIRYMYSIDTGNNFICGKEFLNHNGIFDEIRNENFWNVFPEHQDLKEYFNV
jgi:radical SAM protein with 4Fe4S-binding SPASM domain